MYATRIRYSAMPQGNIDTSSAFNDPLISVLSGQGTLCKPQYSTIAYETSIRPLLHRQPNQWFICFTRSCNQCPLRRYITWFFFETSQFNKAITRQCHSYEPRDRHLKLSIIEKHLRVAVMDTGNGI
jgi:hypothetical protein